MASFRTQSVVLSLAFMGLTGLGACVSTTEFAESVDREWDNPSVEVVPKATPDDPEAQRLRAEMKARQLARLSTNKDCNKILELAPDLASTGADDLDPDLKIARCQYLGMDLASAREHYQSAYDASGNIDALKGLALTELRAGRPERALGFLEQVNDAADVPDIRVLNAIGYANDLLGNYDAARVAFEQAGELRPDEGGAYNNLGMSYLRQNRFDDAVEAFQIALNRDPGLDIARLNLRIALASQGDFATALAGASEAEQATVLNSAGAYAFAEGDIETAEWMFQKALDINPSFYPSAYENLQRARLTDKR